MFVLGWTNLQFERVVLGRDRILLVLSLENFLVPPRVLFNGDDENEAAHTAETNLYQQEIINYSHFLSCFITRCLHKEKLVLK